MTFLFSGFESLSPFLISRGAYLPAKAGCQQAVGLVKIPIQQILLPHGLVGIELGLPTGFDLLFGPVGFYLFAEFFGAGNQINVIAEKGSIVFQLLVIAQQVFQSQFMWGLGTDKALTEAFLAF